MSKFHGLRFSLLAAPSCFLLAYILLMAKAAPFLHHSMWLFGLSLSVGIGFWISYLAYREMIDRQKHSNHLEQVRVRELHSMRENLEEAHLLYREKTDNFEETIQQMEEEYKDLQEGYERVHQECQKEHIRAQALQISLQDALEALRHNRHLDFLKMESGASLPPDLPSRHRQLREQFDEKSLVLHQTRRRLFSIEGQLFALLKGQMEEKLTSNGEIEILQNELALLDVENRRLEEEVQQLESLVTELIGSRRVEKKAPSKKKDQRMLELQFDTH